MADKHDSNGEYGSYSDNFKRKNMPDTVSEVIDCDNEDSNAVNQKTGEYVRELLAEKLSIDQNKLPNATRLIEQEITKAQQMGRPPAKEQKYVDIYREKPIKVTVKVLVPVREHPKFNFVGKLLGPKGNSMKRLQEETMCKMAVLGRGSMKDRQKEEEYRKSLDPKYSHLLDDLHVEISALGPPAEAHARVAYALAEVRKYLIPVNNDNIRQEQMREMEIMTSPDAPSRAEEVEPRTRRPTALPSSSIIRQMPARPPARLLPLETEQRSTQYGTNNVDQLKAAALPRPPPVMRTATRTPVTTRAPVATPRVMPAKTKIMSILDRARVAMEESYGYDEEGYNEPSPTSYEYSSSIPASRSYSAHNYEQDYEPDYYRESSTSYEPSSRTWKPYKSPTSSSSARHTESSRYRTSPYTRPSK